MTPQRWSRIKEIFAHERGLPESPRAAFADAARGGGVIAGVSRGAACRWRWRQLAQSRRRSAWRARVSARFPALRRRSGSPIPIAGRVGHAMTDGLLTPELAADSADAGIEVVVPLKGEGY
jgi:hypothetical protein